MTIVDWFMFIIAVIISCLVLIFLAVTIAIYFLDLHSQRQCEKRNSHESKP